MSTEGKKQWPAREDLTVRAETVLIEPLVNRDRIILPPLHVKLGLMKQFVKAMDKHGSCFNYIVQKFPGLSMENLKAGILDGPQIRKLIQDQAFTSYMTAVESAAWCSYVSVVRELLGNTKATNYQNLVDLMLRNFHALGARKNIELRYLFSHLDYFPENLGDVSKEQGERFHQDIKIMEERYQGRWDAHIMSDIDLCCAGQSYKRKSYKRTFLQLT